jgi:hypothetical protein
MLPEVTENGDSWEISNIRGRICAVYDDISSEHSKLIKVKALGLMSTSNDDIFELDWQIQHHILRSHVYLIPLNFYPQVNQKLDPRVKVARAGECRTLDFEPVRIGNQEKRGLLSLMGNEKLLILPSDKRK